MAFWKWNRCVKEILNLVSIIQISWIFTVIRSLLLTFHVYKVCFLRSNYWITYLQLTRLHICSLNNHLFKCLLCFFQALAICCRYRAIPDSCLRPITNAKERYTCLLAYVFWMVLGSQKPRISITKIWKCQMTRVIFKSFKA